MHTFHRFFPPDNLCAFCGINNELVSKDCILLMKQTTRCLGLCWYLFTVFKLIGVNANLVIAFCLYLDVRTVLGQISSDQETAIV